MDLAFLNFPGAAAAATARLATPSARATGSS